MAYSQTYKSLSQNLFDEVMKRFDEMAIEVDYNKGSMCISFRKGKCYGYSFENADACRGQTECRALFIDELALAPSDLFAITAPCLRGEGIVPKIRFASTPRAGSCWNKLIREHMEKGDWDIFTGTMCENKFLSEESLKMAEDAITDPLMKRQELYGEILDDVVENCIVSLADFVNEPKGRGGDFICGIDFARTGDNTVLCVRNDYELVEQVVLKGADTQKICSEFRRIDATYRFKDVYLDSTGGFDIGFYDTMKHERDNLHEINFGGKSMNPSDNNARTSMYFNLAAAVTNGFYVPQKFGDVIEQIKATSYVIDGRGRRALVPKDVIKDIVGHSPDEADALALTFAHVAKTSEVSHERLRQLSQMLF